MNSLSKRIKSNRKRIWNKIDDELWNKFPAFHIDEENRDWLDVEQKMNNLGKSIFSFVEKRMRMFLPRTIDANVGNGMKWFRINGIVLLLKWQWKTWEKYVEFKSKTRIFNRLEEDWQD